MVSCAVLLPGVCASGAEPGLRAESRGLKVSECRLQNGTYGRRQMSDRPTQIERAFALAASGRMASIKDLRETLKSEGYPEDRQISGGSIRAQLTKLIMEARATAREQK